MFSELGLRIHFVNKLLILLLSDLSLEFESRSKFASVDAEVNWEELPLANVGCSGNGFLVSLLPTLFNKLLNLVVSDGFICGFDINIKCVFKEVLSF